MINNGIKKCETCKYWLFLAEEYPCCECIHLESLRTDKYEMIYEEDES